jgi:hypothetical protein
MLRCQACWPSARQARLVRLFANAGTVCCSMYNSTQAVLLYCIGVVMLMYASGT